MAVHLMTNPPVYGVESDDCVAKFMEERSVIQTGLEARAKLLTEAFNAMKNVTCTDIEGAMYAFPKVNFS